MTLATSILIRQPASVEEVMAFCNRELLGADNPPRWAAEWFEESHPELRRISNMPGLGLPAILDVTYRPDGPVMAELYAEDGEPVEGYGADTGSIIVGFDTAYVFGRGEDYGCSDLHAYFIVRLAEKFGAVTWQNEFTGEWHRLDSDEATAELLSFGDPARGKAAVSVAA